MSVTPRPLSHQVMVAPTLPGHRHILQTLQHTETELQPARLTLCGCGDAHQAPPGLRLCFLPPRPHHRAGAETEQSSEALTNTFVLLCGQTTVLLLKAVDAANQPQRKAVSFGTWASLHPLAAQDRSTHSRGFTPSHSIQPELLGLLGMCFA